MPFIQYILRETNCPRCNAIAQERIEDRNSYAIIIIWCDKCKLKRNVGMTTRRAINLRNRRAKLLKRLDQAKSPGIRKQINAQIRHLDERIKKAEVGI